MKNLSLKLPDALDVKLRAVARKRRASKSDVVRAALESYLAGRSGAAARSVLDLAGDLVGCLEGPGDLSYNKKYMRGFGK
jgi:Arc/MetJ-type ribon-helix-helix transcriptional regulator